VSFDAEAQSLFEKEFSASLRRNLGQSRKDYFQDVFDNSEISLNGLESRVPFLIEFLETVREQPVDELTLFAEMFFKCFPCNSASIADTRSSNVLSDMRGNSAKAAPGRRYHRP
jgi:hypothetical protein